MPALYSHLVWVRGLQGQVLFIGQCSHPGGMEGGHREAKAWEWGRRRREEPGGAPQRLSEHWASALSLEGLELLLIEKHRQKKSTGEPPWWSCGRESALQRKGHWFDPWSRKISHAMEQPSLCTTTTEPVLSNKKKHRTEQSVY